MVVESTTSFIGKPLAEKASHRPLLDGHGRRIRHLRLSVTSACDLKCIYCKPNANGNGSHSLPSGILHSPKLTDRQRIQFVGFLHECFGLSQVRITGGEPLLVPSVEKLIQSLRARAPGLLLAMTTNGQRLAQRADSLRRAGLDRLNVSIDSLDSERYRALTGASLKPVLDGLDAAVALGFPPPKLNSVVLRGHNDHEICDLAAWAFTRGCEMRFLEAMPIGPAAEVNRRLFVSADEMKEQLHRKFSLKPLPMDSGSTALRFVANGSGGSGIVGLIAPMTKPFCGSCGRVRLTSDGRLFPCLLDERYADMRVAWTDHGFNGEIAEQLILEAVRGKRAQGPQRQSVAMVSLGG